MMHKTVRATALVSLVMAIFAASPGKADCGAVTSALSAIEGYTLSIPPAGAEPGWCVLDGAGLRSQRPGWPDLAADRLRLRQSETEFELDLQGLRGSPRATDRAIDDRVRSLLRLQSADLRLLALHDPKAGVVTVSGMRLELSSGAALVLDAEIRGADLSPASLASGTVTKLALVWRNDGRLLRPLMDLAGEDLSGTAGPAAVDAARSALAGLVAALPPAALDDASRKALAEAVRALPQGRGVLTMTLLSPDGIGAGRLAIAALSDDPLAPATMQTLLDGATLVADWQPGLSQ
jgi:hypothetical protein